MPQKIRMRKTEEGEMTGKMYGKKEMDERRAEMTKSLQKKDQPMSAKEKAQAEMDYRKLKAEDRKLNEPTKTERTVGVIMTRKPRIAKMMMEKVARARAAKGVQDEKYRK